MTAQVRSFFQIKKKKDTKHYWVLKPGKSTEDKRSCNVLSLKCKPKSQIRTLQKLYGKKIASGKTYQQAKNRCFSNDTLIKAMEKRWEIIHFNVKNIRRGQMSESVTIYVPVSGAFSLLAQAKNKKKSDGH